MPRGEAALTPSWLPLAAGLASGGAAGFCVRRAHLCSFGAIESLILAGDALRLRVFALALGVAIAGTQTAVGLGSLDLAGVRLLPDVLPAAGALLGGTLFGLGMALTGTCPFGMLLRLGGGDLRAVVGLLVFGAVAWSALAGGLAPVGAVVLEFAALPLAAPDLPRLSGAPRALVAGAAVLAIAAWVLADRRLRRAPRLLLAGTVLGLAVVASWMVTGPAADPFAAATRPPQGLSFVAPVARALYGMLLAPGTGFGFAEGAVFGALAGSCAAALARREFRWDAFDEPREMGRHLLGACLMAVGGVWASGCTIGQGLSAGSLLAPSWPLAIGGILLGARLGIAALLRDAPWAALRGWRQRPRLSD